MYQYVPGLGSAEGLVAALDGKDKVVLVSEGEFRSITAKGNQGTSNTLIPKLTDIYDCPPIITLLTRSNPITSINPFLSILTSSTPEWLSEHLPEGDIWGGFANRFLFVKGYYTKAISWPKSIDTSKSQVVALHLKEIRDWASVHAASDSKGFIEVPEELKKEIWEPYYLGLRDRMRDMRDINALLLQRVSEYAVKLSLLYAAADMSSVVSAEHLNMAIAFSKQTERDIIQLFSGFGETSYTKTEKRVEEYIRMQGGKAARRDIQRKFNMSKKSLEEVVKYLLASGEYRESTERSEHGKPSKTLLRISEF
jgi:hypothetical protein